MKTNRRAAKYIPSDAVRHAATRPVADYSSPTEMKFDLSFLRNALGKCTADNAAFVDTLTGKIRDLESALTKAV